MPQELVHGTTHTWKITMVVVMATDESARSHFGNPKRQVSPDTGVRVVGIYIYEVDSVDAISGFTAKCPNVLVPRAES
jgi:hypothetical protein